MVQREDLQIDSDGIHLASSVFTPEGAGPHPGLVLCHGMPAVPRPAPGTPAPAPAEGELDYPALAELCAWEGFTTLIFNFRGSGESGGDFHHLGWARDLDAVVTRFRKRRDVDPRRIALLGSSLGAAVAIYVTARRSDVAGLVSFASPASMGPRQNPAEAVERLRALGVIRDRDFPPSLETWATEGAAISPMEWIGRIAPRPLLLLHGDADDVVDPESARILFERAQEPKELRMLPGVGHRFRSETAAIGTALEWLKERFL